MIPNPQTNAAEFWQMARAMAVYSARAYGDHTVCAVHTGAQALVCRDADCDIIVAFKGSSTPRDFLEDAEAWRTRWIWPHGESETRPVEVHHGFLADFEEISVDVVSQVKALLALKPAAQIYITGHSLGGALAIPCALEFARQGLPVAGVFTFGQPRVGNAAFAALYNGALVSRPGASAAATNTPGQETGAPTLKSVTFRIVNQNDIVPRLPGWLAGYRHCGQEIFLEPLPAGGWGANPSLAYKLLCDVLGLYAAYRNREDVLFREHFMAAYQERIKYL